MFPSIPSRGRRLAAIVSIPILALILSGCFVIRSQTVVQEKPLGDLVITTEMCDTDPLTTSTTPCQSGLSQAPTADGQYYIGYVIDNFLTAPTTVEWKGTLGTIALTQSPSFAAGMETIRPARAGHHWVAYGTGRIPKLAASTEYSMTATARFAVPEDAPAAASVATFTGERFVRDAGSGITALPVDRAVNCDEKDPDNGQASTWCGSSGTPEQTATSPGSPVDTAPVELNTLKLKAPVATLTVDAGTKATLNFGRASHAAGGVATSVPLKATSTIAGATITADAAVDLSDAASVLPVQVEVPAGTASGTYDVKITAAGGLRSASAKLTVHQTTLQESVDALLVLLKDKAKVKAIRRANTFDFPLFAPQPGTLATTLKKGNKVLATGKRKVTAAGATTLRLVPNNIGRKILRSGKSYSGTLTISLKTAGGTQRAKTAKVTFGGK